MGNIYFGAQPPEMQNGIVSMFNHEIFQNMQQNSPLQRSALILGATLGLKTIIISKPAFRTDSLNCTPAISKASNHVCRDHHTIGPAKKLYLEHTRSFAG